MGKWLESRLQQYSPLIPRTSMPASVWAGTTSSCSSTSGHWNAMKKSVEADPNNAYVTSLCAGMLRQLGRDEEAIQMAEKTIALDPGFTSGYFYLAVLHQKLGQRDKAKSYLNRFGELRSPEFFGGVLNRRDVRGISIPYDTPLDAGKLPLAAHNRPVETRILLSPNVHRLEAELKPWNWSGGSVRLPGVAVGDLNKDRHLDLVLTATDADGATSIWLNDGKGNFTQTAQVS